MKPYQIQWDNISRKFPFRVVTISGRCLGYFMHERDAKRFCNELMLGMGA